MAEVTLRRPGLYLVEADLDDFSVRGTVVAGRSRAVVWDTLARPVDMHGVEEVISGLPFDVVYSHGDWDHVLGTSGLARPPGHIIAHDSCPRRFADELPTTLEGLAEKGQEEYRTFPLSPPTRTFEAELELDLGGVSLELRRLQGHTPDTIVGFIPQWNVLLAGDAVETPLPFLNPGSPIQSWIEMLKAWAERMDSAPEPATVIPSHGVVGGTGLLRSTVCYLEDILAGQDPREGRELPPFYQETHGMNLKIAAAQSLNSPSR